MTEIRDTLQSGLANSYRLERELGRGGMATVFLATDLRHKRSVALKVLHPELSQVLGPERFEREIHTVARLQHPHILAVHDSGATAGQLWFTMPFVEGESLRDRLQREQQLPVDVALRIAGDAARALHYAHKHGVIHRDIKPENLLLTQDGSALVADFGIAATQADADDRLTATGMSVGTPVYMSPEQAMGDRHLDARTDVYSLGTVLYEMLAGEPPFTGATAQAVIAKRFSGEIPQLRRVRPSVPESIEQAINRALAPIAADRWSSAEEFARALSVTTSPANVSGSQSGSDLASPPVEGMSHPSPADTALPGRVGGRARSRFVVGAVLALVLGASAWWLLARRTAPAARAASIAVLPFANMSGGKDEEYLSDGMAEELINALSRIEGLQVSARTSSFAFKGQNADVREVGSKLGVAAVLEGSVRRAGDRVRVAVQLVDATSGYRRWSDSYDRHLADIFALQDEVARTVVATLLPRLISEPAASGDTTLTAPVETQDPEVYLLVLKARHAMQIQTEAEVRKALEFATQAIRRDSSYSDAYVVLAQVYSLLGHRDIVVDSLAIPRANAAVRRALQLNPNNPEALVALAQVLGFQRDFSGARRELERALKIKPSDAWAHDLKAFFLVVTEGLTPAAIAEMRLAQRLDPLESGHNHNLGMMLLSQKATAEAVHYFNQSIALEPRSEASYSALGVALAMLGRHAEADAQVRKALAIAPTAPDVLTDQAYVAILAGQPDEARTIRTQLEREIGRELGALYIATVHAMLGERDAAFEWLDRVSWDPGALLNLRVDIRLESLRSDRRYLQLLHKVGLTA